jgi:hypothetical protein
LYHSVIGCHGQCEIIVLVLIGGDFSGSDNGINIRVFLGLLEQSID